MKAKINLTDNLFLKILSVVIAVLIWLVVMNINDAEKTRSFPVPVELVNTEVITTNGKVFRVVEGGDYVNVKVRARKSIIDQLDRTDFILTADMEKDLKYDRLVGITVECKNKSINIDEQVTLSRSNIEVSIEDSVTEQFQVHVKHTGEPNNGLVVGSLIPEQTIIKISGPVSLVERIKTVEAMVDITGIPGSTVRTCELKLYDSAGGIIDNTYLKYVGKTGGIDVTVSMLNTKTVPLKFNYTGTPADNYVVKDISYKPEIIEIAGSAEVLSHIFRWEIPSEAVNVNGISEELQLVVDLEQYLPSGVILKNEEEASALVIVEVEYVEPVEDEVEEDEDDDKVTTKPSTSETTKPSTSETTKPSTTTKPTDKEDTTVKPENKPTQTPPSTDTEGSENSGNGSQESSKDDENQKNETGSGADGKTESNS